MGRPKKWPSYALESLENTLALLDDFDRDLRRAQEAVAAGDEERAQILMGDARVASRRCVEHLLRARTGEYKRDEANAWPATKSSDASTQPTATGLAHRTKAI